METIVRARRKGQITIPDRFRRELGIGDDTLLRVSVQDGELRLKPVKAADEERGSPWLRELYEYFAPVRQEAIDRGYTEQLINDAIDEAIREVRAERRDPRD